MKLKCPKCKRVLPQIGNDVVTSGDRVTCGMCNHSWMFGEKVRCFFGSAGDNHCPNRATHYQVYGVGLRLPFCDRHAGHPHSMSHTGKKLSMSQRLQRQGRIFNHSGTTKQTTEPK